MIASTARRVGTTPGEVQETQRTYCRTGEAGPGRRPEEDRRARKADHRTRKTDHRSRTTARPAQEELHKLFQAPFLRWFGRRAKTARPQAQEPTETRRPTELRQENVYRLRPFDSNPCLWNKQLLIGTSAASIPGFPCLALRGS